jgi:EmrB/QacA subfamily drug resistance transporter
MNAGTTRVTHRVWTVVGLMLSLAMAALEATVVATAMPTVKGDLGGIEYYAWVTNAYLVTSAVTVPIFGKLADLYGRKPVLIFGIFVFLIGSAASGAAISMPMLIGFRALQGLGAGAMQPMPLTIVGDIFGLEERAKAQGAFGAAWGFFGLVGPLLGGFIVEHVSWRWVFFMNIPFGIAAILVLSSTFHENLPRKSKPRLDVLGAFLLMAIVVMLLVATGRTHEPTSILYFVVAIVLLGAFIFVEKRAPEPIMPLQLFKSPVIRMASIINAAAGGCMFALMTYIPLFVQGVRHGTPTQAGSSITPMLVCWPIASFMAGRVIPKIGFRPLVRTGIVGTALGSILLAVFAHQGSLPISIASALFGIGMGFANIALVIAVQSSVSWEYRGVATASTMFFRINGGAIAVGLMGGILVRALSVDPTIPKDAASRMLAKEGLVSMPPELLERISVHLEKGLGTIFWLIAGLSVFGATAALFFPYVPPSQAPPAGAAVKQSAEG